MIDWLIKLVKPYPYSHLAFKGKPYMRRWWVWPRYKKKETGFGLRLHQILRSDDDRYFHDHHGWYISIILRGGYWEVTPLWDESGLYVGPTSKWYGPGSIRFRFKNSWHRLVVPEGTQAWTLFMQGKVKQKWGFLKEPKFKIPFTEYKSE